MPKLLFIVASTIAIALLLQPPLLAEPVDGPGAFEQLKALGGTWRGGIAGEGAEADSAATLEVVHEFRVSAAGTVVMETMGPGSEHEMINMYHLDGADLVLTHYCAGGNQPTMKLDLAASTDQTLVFAFTGGTSLDPEVDEHIHSAELTFKGANELDSAWTANKGAEEVGVTRFHLQRE